MKKRKLINFLKKNFILFRRYNNKFRQNNRKIKRKKIVKIKFDKLWIHGLAHLLGFRHKSNKDYIKMKKLKKIFLNL